MAVLLAVLGAAHIGHAEELQGKVVRVTDGDTITVLDERLITHKVRLASIDAPERRQAHYQAARSNLISMVLHKQVVVTWHKRDRYGRIVGVARVNGKDVGLEQIHAGFAWWFRRYATEQSLEDRSRYEKSELDARTHRRGLWSEIHVTAPWDWRKDKM